jgi:multidrug resistance efflux pump
VIAFLIIVYVAIILVLFKVLRIKPTAYLIASMIVAGVSMIGGVVVVGTQSAPITDKMVASQYVVQLVPYVKGQVKTIYAQTLQPMKKGELLLEIDPAPCARQRSQAGTGAQSRTHSFTVAAIRMRRSWGGYCLVRIVGPDRPSLQKHREPGR